MMKVVKKFVFAVSICLSLALTGVANAQGDQGKKRPEKVKEQPKPDKGRDKDDRRGDDRKNDDKKRDERKKPDFMN